MEKKTNKKENMASRSVYFHTILYISVFRRLHIPFQNDANGKNMFSTVQIQN